MGEALLAWSGAWCHWLCPRLPHVSQSGGPGTGWGPFSSSNSRGSTVLPRGRDTSSREQAGGPWACFLRA